MTDTKVKRTLTIQDVKQVGKIWYVKAADSEGTVTNYKMFDGSYQKNQADVAPGKSGEFDIENKGDESKADWFILWPKSPGGGGGGGYKGGGGVAKSDPAKNEVIKQANTRNNDTIREANIRNSITAIAVAGVTAIGEEAKDANALRAWVEDVHKTVEDLVREANS